MATGNEILGYRGDAASGIASSAAATSAFGASNTEPISDLVKNIALNNFQKNREIFRQKIADRDQAFKMLDDEQLVLNNILETDRGMVNERVSKVRDIFMKANGDIMGNPQVYREFQSAINDAKNHIKQAQKRFLGVEADLKERKDVGNPIDQAKYDQHISNQQKKGFWDTYVPFAPITDYNLDVVAAPWKTTERTYEDGLYNVKEVLPDVQTTMNEYRGKYLKNDYNHWFHKYVDDMIKVPNADALVTRVQEGIERLNASTGAKPGDVNYVEPLKATKVGDEWQLQDDYGTAAAKIKLSEAQKVTSREFDPQRSARDLKLKDQAIDRAQLAETTRHNKATEGLQRANLQWDKDKWAASTRGGDETKSAAMVFAENLVGGMSKIASREDKSTGKRYLTSDDIRKLNQEQLKYLGFEGETAFSQKDDKGKTIAKGTRKGLVPLSLRKDDVLEIDQNGNIRVMANAKLDKNGRFFGTYDAARSTSIGNVAINRLNEENSKAGSKEINAYVPLDLGETRVQTTTSGGGTSQSGSTSTKARTVIQNGVTYTWNPNTGQYE